MEAKSGWIEQNTGGCIGHGTADLIGREVVDGFITGVGEG